MNDKEFFFANLNSFVFKSKKINLKVYCRKCRYRYKSFKGECVKYCPSGTVEAYKIFEKFSYVSICTDKCLFKVQIKYLFF